ncbi:hypothetical protein Nepgr_018921 [Nepenthes gracilis]|uniref:EF-hand domain-containing protein n=1 Tax=Nepenthes gracilis TaxID=150966 RepID=A0AAD3SUA6_NEPGR|nr:hypothetical protein Nepgr_018921 [Nepenthes gracilis]
MIPLISINARSLFSLPILEELQSHSHPRFPKMASSDDSGSSKSSRYLQKMEEVKKVFSRFDTNSDGLISSTELVSVLDALGSETTPEEVEKMMEEMDADRDGYVNLQEFADFCAKKVDGDESGSGELRDAFDMYDQDRNGLISVSELHLILRRLGEKCSVQDCVKMIQSVDSDGDGNVSFEEFKKMMTTNKTS